MEEFENLDEGTAQRKPQRRHATWVTLGLLCGFVGLAAVLYLQYDVWLHPLHEPTPLDIARADLHERLRGNFELLSSEELPPDKGQTMLRVKYRQKSGPRWLNLDRIYAVQDGNINWSMDFDDWKLLQAHHKDSP